MGREVGRNCEESREENCNENILYKKKLFQFLEKEDNSEETNKLIEI